MHQRQRFVLAALYQTRPAVRSTIFTAVAVVLVRLPNVSQTSFPSRGRGETPSRSRTGAHPACCSACSALHRVAGHAVREAHLGGDRPVPGLRSVGRILSALGVLTTPVPPWSKYPSVPLSPLPARRLLAVAGVRGLVHLERGGLVIELVAGALHGREHELAGAADLARGR